MKIPTINELLRSKLLVAGLIFFLVNIGYTYKFYQVNSFKILMVLIGVSVLAVWSDLLFPKKVDSRFPWKQTLIVAVPLIATLPGIIWYQGDYNYNFRYELASNLILIVWITYLYRGTETKDDLHPFFLLIGVTVIYAGLWAFLERAGLHPYNWGAPVSRVKSTFGNINYFAGFLVVLTPVLLTLFLPNSLKDLRSFKALFPASNRASFFYSVAFIFAVVSLILTQTRAAQGATMVSLAVVVFFYVYAFIPADYKKMTLVAGIVIGVTGVLLIVLLFLIRDYLPETRYTSLLFLEGWTPRFAGWIPAINSIKASPLIGFGLGSSYNLYFYFIDPDSRLIHAEHSYNHVHSEILEYMQEAGIIGFVVYLLFWSYIAFLLFKTISSEKSDPLLKKIAVGIIGGFIGYHLQGAFSVAPRMMVVKLPLFTLIGLTFVLVKLSFEQKTFETNHSMLARTKSVLPALIVLTFVWIMFSPWLIGQNSFIKNRSSRPSLAQVEKLEKIVKKYPDAYALDHLTHLQIKYRRTKQLQETVDMIDQVLPHYRDLGYTKALLALINKETLKGKKVAIEFQNTRDRYHQANIFLLMGIAIDSNDYELFKT
ncbi:MAG: O-antigen ligase family protein, partial [Proteobacteria bacterium]|nr:O-antigen ligase family protein [Pseudomonadota bacterium]